MSKKIMVLILLAVVAFVAPAFSDVVVDQDGTGKVSPAITLDFQNGPTVTKSGSTAVINYATINAATVTTNADLTGPITSTGNATAVTPAGITCAGINWSDLKAVTTAQNVNWADVTGL